MKELKERLSSLSGGRILDIATGRGSFIKLLTESFKDFEEAVGIDNSPESSRLQDAAKSFNDGRIQFVFMDAEKLEFPNESFDTVSISNSIHHLYKPEKVLEEMYRVLKPGGLLIVNEMYNDNQTEHQLTHVYLHHWWADIDSRNGINHFHTLSREELLDRLSLLCFRSLETLDYAELDIDYKDKEESDYLNRIINDYLEKARNLPDFEALKVNGEKHRKRLNDIGIASATQLIAIGIK